MPEFELVEPDGEVYEDYASNFGPYNTQKAGWTVETFSLVKRKGDSIVAGGCGHVYLGALEVRGLWVNEDLRGIGMGRDLLTAIEGEARGRGATKAMLYTYSWQAEAFYQKAGYKAYAKFDFPTGQYRVDMQKTL